MLGHMCLQSLTLLMLRLRYVIKLKHITMLYRICQLIAKFRYSISEKNIIKENYQFITPYIFRYMMQVLLKQGVTQLMLPGLGQIGCTPIILTLFPSSNRSDYDTSGCLRKYNTIATYHSQLLTQAVRQLRARFPQARIIFADYYGPEIAALQTPELFGQLFHLIFSQTFIIL